MKSAAFEDVVLTPEKHYEVPAEVSADQRWSLAQKEEILRAWKSNEEALLRAADEGLDGGERPHLGLVAKELRKIEEA